MKVLVSKKRCFRKIWIYCLKTIEMCFKQNTLFFEIDNSEYQVFRSRQLRISALNINSELSFVVHPYDKLQREIVYRIKKEGLIQCSFCDAAS